MPVIAAGGVAVSALVTAMVDPLLIPTWVEKFVNWCCPATRPVAVLVWSPMPWSV